MLSEQALAYSESRATLRMTLWKSSLQKPSKVLRSRREALSLYQLLQQKDYKELDLRRV